MSPLDINANVAVKMKPPAAAKPKTAASKQREKDHPPPPPAEVLEPFSADRPNGAVYQTGRLLGKGGFAICHEGVLAGTRQIYALKIVKAMMPQKKMEQKVRTSLHLRGYKKQY